MKPSHAPCFLLVDDEPAECPQVSMRCLRLRINRTGRDRFSVKDLRSTNRFRYRLESSQWANLRPDHASILRGLWGEAPASVPR